jgi:glucosamine-6-phosphate deaminase
MLKKLIAEPQFAKLHADGYFSPRNAQGRSRDIWLYLDGVAAKDEAMRNEGTARRLLRSLIEVFDESDLRSVANRIEELTHYFESGYPGKKDLDFIQVLKGMCREWEAECLWGYFGWNCENVKHLRLGFYTGDIFTPEPTVNRDIPPILNLIKDAKPDIVTLALDPEASGPDTHYKALQAVTEALRAYQTETGRADIRIWGYRNVWYRFHPSEATMFVPVSLNMFTIMENAFLNTFISQKDASFPSHELDGPFCELARKIQTQQYQTLKVCLGRDWFHEHPNAMIRATRGLVYIREMSLDELYEHSRTLRRATENA